MQLYMVGAVTLISQTGKISHTILGEFSQLHSCQVANLESGPKQSKSGRLIWDFQALFINFI